MPVLERINNVERATFQKLRKYTFSQVALINAYARLFESAASWDRWIEETLQEVLEVPCGLRLEITQASELHGEQPQTYTFEKREIFIGRTNDNDIALPLRSISRRHARIVERDGSYHIEDLESASGTYVNRHKLEIGHLRRLTEGDEVLIFPYTFRVNPRESWVPDKEVEISYSRPFAQTSTAEFASGLGSDVCFFQLALHPDMGRALLAVTRPFFKLILSRLTRDNVSELVETDSALFEFVVVRVLERINRELRFPFECRMAVNKDLGLQNESGVALELAVRLAKVHGSVQIFLPHSFLNKAQNTAPPKLPAGANEYLTWQIMVCIGFVDITADDLDDIEPEDTLICTPQMELILPAHGTSECGWYLLRDDNNPRRFVVKGFFERSVLMEDDTNLQTEADQEKVEPDHTETASTVDFAALPVRIHVVLSQVELSLRDLEGLTEGSVIELDAENTGAVQLVANGKVLGTGDLVEVDDHLGVQITRWRRG